jgi:hypothetical protein
MCVSPAFVRDSPRSSDMTRKGAIQKPVALLNMPLSDTGRLAMLRSMGAQEQVVYLTLELKFL